MSAGKFGVDLDELDLSARGLLIHRADLVVALKGDNIAVIKDRERRVGSLDSPVALLFGRILGCSDRELVVLEAAWRIGGMDAVRKLVPIRIETPLCDVVPHSGSARRVGRLGTPE